VIDYPEINILFEDSEAFSQGMTGFALFDPESNSMLYDTILINFLYRKMHFSDIYGDMLCLQAEQVSLVQLNKKTHLKCFLSVTSNDEKLIGSTGQGICLISFMDGKLSTEDFISTEIQNGIPVQQQRDIHVETVKFFQGNLPEGSRLKLHLMGTPFQISVWRALLEIWPGRLITYGELANGMGEPNASRAVGSVIGQNHIAYLIPCHRVITSTGVIGNYRWGSDRKIAMIGRELSQKEKARLR